MDFYQWSKKKRISWLYCEYLAVFVYYGGKIVSKFIKSQLLCLR